MAVTIPGTTSNSSVTASVTREYLHLDDASKLGSNAIDYSATSTPQGAKVQAALNFAAQASSQGHSNSTVFIAGHILCNDVNELQIPITGAVRILGAGAGEDRVHSAACLRWTTDPGAGKYLINPGLTPYPYRLENFTIAGPYSDDPISGGAEPVLATGMFLDTRGIAMDIRVLGCNAGADLINDHQDLIRCDFKSNVYGVKYGPNATGGLGDEKFERCYLTDQSRASIAVCDSGTIAFLRMIQGHAGAAPYFIWRYPHFFPATGGTGSATITGVNITQFVPIAGHKVTGPNIPANTVIASGGVAGTSGNYSLTLSATPTGTVTKAMVGSRTTFLSGISLDTQSIEGADVEIYDEVYDVWGIPGSVSSLSLNFPGESSTFAAPSQRHWAQFSVAATGGTGSATLTGVAVTQFVPHEGMQVSGTNIPTGTRIVIGGISGSSGNYSLTLSATPTGTVTAVTVAKPSTGIANIDVHSVDGIVWRDGGPFFQPPHPLIRALTINNVLLDGANVIKNAFVEGAYTAGTVRPFQLKGSYNAFGTESKNVHMGRGSGTSGATLFASAVCNEAVSRGDLLERTGFQHCQKYRATSKPLGISLDDFSQGEMAVYCYSVTNESSIKVINRSGVSIAATSLLKPDTTNAGGVVAATSITDGPIVGKLQNGGALAGGGTLGQADIFI